MRISRRHRLWAPAPVPDSTPRSASPKSSVPNGSRPKRSWRRRCGSYLAQLNLQYTRLRAPVDGVVANRSARVGAYAGIGTQLLSVVPAQGLWVDANFKENQLAAMHAGQVVAIHADVLPNVTFHGQVTS